MCSKVLEQIMVKGTFRGTLTGVLSSSVTLVPGASVTGCAWLRGLMLGHRMVGMPMDRNIKQKIRAWAIFLGFFLLLSLGATPYWKIVDQVYRFLGLTAMAVISILVVRHKWRGVLMNPPDEYTLPPLETRDKVLRSTRRWCSSDKNPNI